MKIRMRPKWIEYIRKSPGVYVSVSKTKARWLHIKDLGPHIWAKIAGVEENRAVPVEEAGLPVAGVGMTWNLAEAEFQSRRKGA
jgi:hypothetical protein